MPSGRISDILFHDFPLKGRMVSVYFLEKPLQTRHLLPYIYKEGRIDKLLYHVKAMPS